ncbi:ribosome biogenesis GTP-binding protein YihA/YsxC [Alphaproteobacteria bacterium]|nr:ribosome biogenesis GTP-binding protein YihA/YsxC [Alphaproteobacteria bacterium]
MQAPLLPSQDSNWLKTGRWLFAQACTFQKGSTKVSNLPMENLDEVAFAGRSNVGKSSLINALTNQKKLARISNTPGRTQEINFFDLGDKGGLVDLPGYGYAQISKEKRLEWSAFVFSFLKGRSKLKRVYVLIDSRHGLKPTDEELFKALDKSAVSYQIILTKSDKIKASNRETIVADTQTKLSKFVAAHPVALLTSSEKGDGIDEVRAEIAALFMPEPRDFPST